MAKLYNVDNECSGASRISIGDIDEMGYRLPNQPRHGYNETEADPMIERSGKRIRSMLRKH